MTPSNGFPMDPEDQGERPTVYDPTVMGWIERPGLHLSPSHDSTEHAVGAFFTAAGGKIAIAQGRIADVAQLSRAVVNERLADLVEVGLLGREKQSADCHGKREDLYWLPGELTDWEPVENPPCGRLTVKEWHHLRRIAELEDAVLQLAPLSGDLDDNLTSLVNSIPTTGSQISFSFSFNRGEKNDLTNNDTAVVNQNSLQRGGDNAFYTPTGSTVDRNFRRIPGSRMSASESQMNRLMMEQDRTGLTDADILASWLDVQPKTDPPECIEVAFLTSSRASRIIQWLIKQGDKPLPPPAPDDAVTYSTISEGKCTCFVAVVVESDPEAKRCWDEALGQLELDLPSAIFETWLKQTEGIGFNGTDLLVEVPHVFTITWLEQRMYQTILRALRESSGQPLDVRFRTQTTSCGIHGNATAGPDLDAVE